MDNASRTLKTAVLVLVLVAISWIVADHDARAQTLDATVDRERLVELNPQNPADARILLSQIRATTRKACGRPTLETLQYRIECLQMSYANALATFSSSHGIDLEAIAGSTVLVSKLTVASE